VISITPYTAYVLLREQLLPRLATLPTTVAAEAAVHEAGETQLVTRVMELIDGTIGRWPVHWYDWYLHRLLIGEDVSRVHPWWIRISQGTGSK
jgi:hypothetical protein